MGKEMDAGTLVLPVRQQYFDAIRNGSKTVEYRAYKKYWIEQIEEQAIYDIKVVLAGTDGDSEDNAMYFPFVGYRIEVIDSVIYGPNAKVFAIDLQA